MPGTGITGFFSTRRQKEKEERELLRKEQRAKRAMDIHKHTKPVTCIDFVDLSQVVVLYWRVKTGRFLPVWAAQGRSAVMSADDEKTIYWDLSGAPILDDLEPVSKKSMPRELSNEYDLLH